MKISTKILITVFLIMFILWNRLIRMRLPRNLDDFTLFGLIIVFLLVLLFFFLTIKLVFELIEKQNKNNMIDRFFEYSFIKNILMFVKNIANAPKDAYNYFADNYDYFTRYIELSASFITVYFPYSRVLVMFFIFLPQILVATVFFYDVMFVYYLETFYNSLKFLLIPIGFKCYIHMVSFHATTFINYIEAHMDIIPGEKGLYFKLKTSSPQIENALSLSEMKIKFSWFVSTWRINNTLKNFSEAIYQEEYKYVKYIKIYTVICYLSGWLYILIYNFIS
jgi:hypothetical protein